MTIPHSPVPDTLTRVAVEVESYVAQLGWDQRPRLFALVPTAELLAVADDVARGGSAAGAEGDRPVAEDGQGPDDLSAVEQEWSPGTDLEAALARIAWPESVAGVALAIERIVVPPEAEHDLPGDPEAAMAALAAHPDRRDVRLVAAVTRGAARTCLLRQRAYDSADMVATGPEIASGLLNALAATLLD
ncbi:MAG: PPA1309 family protein [Dermatophilaceae bacterium]